MLPSMNHSSSMHNLRPVFSDCLVYTPQIRICDTGSGTFRTHHSHALVSSGKNIFIYFTSNNSDVLTFPNVDGFTCVLLNYFTYDFQLPFEGAQIPIVHVGDRIHIWSRQW